MVLPYEADSGRFDEAGVPSTPEEALWTHVTGAIYGTAMHELRAQRRVRVKFPVESGYPLVSAWDLGINDATAIWAVQVVGYELRWRKFYQSSGKELAEYAEAIRAWERESLGTDAAKTLGEALFCGLVPLTKGFVEQGECVVAEWMEDDEGESVRPRRGGLARMD